MRPGITPLLASGPAAAVVEVVLSVAPPLLDTKKSWWHLQVARVASGAGCRTSVLI